MTRSNNLCYLVWLEWPEKCFRMDAKTLSALKAAVMPKGGRVIRVKSEAAFLKHLPEATHALVWNFKEEWFAKAPRLKVLATPAAGQEFVPTKGPKGVKIHFGSFHGVIMAETVAAFMLAWCRGFFRLREAAGASVDWPRTWLSDKCFGLGGTQAVILGYGHIGRAIGQKLAKLGVEVTGITRHGVYRGGSKLPCKIAEKFLHEANWLILALPSTTGTDNLLDAKLICKLPRRCVIVNVGRGNAVDEKALYKALKTKRLAGAYLDVRKHEPSATVLESPGYVPELAELTNCIVMPHASAFDENYLKLFVQELKHDRCL